MRKAFFVRAVWDEEAKVFYSESDINGLHIEAATVEEFEDIMKDLAVDMITANHISLKEMASRPLRDLIPTILWERPEKNGLMYQTHQDHLFCLAYNGALRNPTFTKTLPISAVKSLPT